MKRLIWIAVVYCSLIANIAKAGNSHGYSGKPGGMSGNPSSSSSSMRVSGNHSNNNSSGKNWGNIQTTTPKFTPQVISGGNKPHFDPKITLPKFDPKNSMPRDVITSHKPDIKTKPVDGIHLPGNLGNIVNTSHGSSHNNNHKTNKLPALKVSDLQQSKVHVDKPFDMKTAASFAPKSLTCQPHFDWWVLVLNSHHCHHYGSWNCQTYNWDYWRPCTYTTVLCQRRSYFVGLTCVFIPDMQAYGVQTVSANSPAEAAGVKPGDIILSINGRSIAGDGVLKEELSRGRLDLEFVRDGEPEGIKATVFPRLLTTVSY